VRNSEPDRILSYLRRGPDGEFLVVINCSNRPFLGLLDAATDFRRLAGSDLKPAALPSVALEAWGFQILEHKGAGR